MHLPGFENDYFLRSLGWAIVNSFWQVGTLWLLYYFITLTDKKISSVVKYYISLIMLGASTTWFIFTLYENYQVLNKVGSIRGEIFGAGWTTFILRSNLLSLVSIIYFVLLAFYAIDFIRKLLGNHFLQKNGLSKPSIDIRLYTNNTAIHLGIKRNVQVWISEHIDVPSVTGFLKPVILLPAAIVNNLSIKQVEAILLHELAHIKRKDFVINIAQTVIEVIFFFNPFVYLLNKIARKERENCCDDWVLNFRYDQHDYASALLILEEQRNSQLPLLLTATNDSKALLKRIKRLFNTAPEIKFNPVQRLKVAGVFIVLLVGILMFIPVLDKPQPNPHPNATVKSNLKKLYPAAILISSPEIAQSRTLKNQPVIANAEKVAPIEKKTTISIKESNNQIEAFINEDLLEAPVEAPMVVADKLTGEIVYFVKIEEQQSGSKEIKTYFLELNNKAGVPAIKPLLILREFKEKYKELPGTKQKDSLAIASKKRVTS